MGSSWFKHPVTHTLLALGVCFPLLALAQPSGGGGEGMTKALPLEESLIKARVNNKYAMLLRQFKVPGDAAQHKDFAEMGQRDLPSYSGHSELPKGYWVYVYPYWYIWRDQAAVMRAKMGYGPEQLTGPPDVPMRGDSSQAWCSQSADDQDEWLLCEYATPVTPTAVLVYANYNPGAVARVTAYRLDGVEVELWKGQDPTPPESEHGVSVIPLRADFKTNRIKVYLNSIDTPSWNEVDTIGLRDDADQAHWPVAAEASSTYGRNYSEFTGFMPANSGLSERIQSLEAEVKELKEMLKDRKLEAEVRELKGLIRELKEELKKRP
jgi:hypothetical protein